MYHFQLHGVKILKHFSAYISLHLRKTNNAKWLVWSLMTRRIQMTKTSWNSWRKECGWITSITGESIHSVKSTVYGRKEGMEIVCQDLKDTPNFVQYWFHKRERSNSHAILKCILKANVPINLRALLTLNRIICLQFFLCRIIDNMPVTWCYDFGELHKFCNPGFPVGCFVASDGRAKDSCTINVSGQGAFP